jgi:hypothetical protein
MDSLTFYEAAKRCLINLTLGELSFYNRDQIEVIVDVHVDPRNYVMDLIFDFNEIQAAISLGKNCDDVSKLLTFENIKTFLGVFRIHCRDLVNRQRISDINKGGINKSKAPKIMKFLDPLDDKSWHDFGNMGTLAEYFIHSAKTDKNEIFDEDDMQSLLAIKNNLRPNKLNWLKVLNCINGGVIYFNKFGFDINRFFTHIRNCLRTYEGMMSLLSEYRRIKEIGPALAPNFFSDLGFKEFCKPDIHVCTIINGLYDHNMKENEVFNIMLKLAMESKVPPRQLDKVFFLAGSGNYYLTGHQLSKGSNIVKRRNLLVEHLRKR